MTKMRRVLAALVFGATIALSLTATQGTAWAATFDAQSGVSVETGRGSTQPKSILPPSTGGMLTAFSVTWED
jgi:hypothetical protein